MKLKQESLRKKKQPTLKYFQLKIDGELP